MRGEERGGEGEGEGSVIVKCMHACLCVYVIDNDHMKQCQLLLCVKSAHM
jgi:hypothetical protein